MVDNINPKPVGWVRASNLTMLGIGLDVQHTTISREQKDVTDIPLYTKATDWKLISNTPAPQSREIIE